MRFYTTILFVAILSLALSDARSHHSLRTGATNEAGCTNIYNYCSDQFDLNVKYSDVETLAKTLSVLPVIPTENNIECSHPDTLILSCRLVTRFAACVFSHDITQSCLYEKPHYYYAYKKCKIIDCKKRIKLY